MARPDLDAIESGLNADLKEWIEADRGSMPSCIKDISELLAYCRELEAENKRLRDEQGKDLKRYANWLEAAGDCGP